MWRSDRFSATFSQSCQAPTASPSRSSHCPARAPADGRLTMGRSVPGRQGLQPALVVEAVHAARQPQALGSESGVVDLAVIADVLDDPLGPLVVDAEQLAEIPLHAEIPAHVWICGVLGHLVGV